MERIMIPTTIKACFQTLFIVFLSQIANGQDRKITYKFNPGCDACVDENNTLVYTRAQGSHDTVHQIWDFTAGSPTVILSVAGVNSTLNITWDGTVPSRFKFSETPKYSFATVIDKIYEYNDLQDAGYIDARSPRRVVPLRHVSWRLATDVRTDDEVMVLMRGHLRSEHRHGTIDVKLDLIPFKDYAVELPHLIHTANSTLADISLVNLTASRDYNSSRFALRVLLASVDDSNDTMRYAMRKSLDDEHTPGVFEVIY
ncbi:glycosylated lysosomal membrane protein-like [Ostrinia furnacalis]|uniref:glycosylated lysosomal membrane protein-like n=1 Tax=Ostrinia furnacalis TaxID=93504 RepID=UPI00103D4D1A|nr:glycosylated lysosomal membrane protein-like [Ostrinia furnacalis]